MRVNIITDQDTEVQSEDFRELCSEVFRLHGWTDKDSLTLVRDPMEMDGKTILMGKPPALFKDISVDVSTISPRETLGTPGGKTKLSWAVRQLLKPFRGPEFEWSYTRTTRNAFWPLGETLAVDIEVSGDITVDEPEDTELLSVAIAWRAKDKIKGMVWDKEDLRHVSTSEQLDYILSNNTLLAHNGMFDFRWINSKLGTNFTPDEDTQLLHHVMFPGAKEHGLKPLAQRILGAEDWDADMKAKYLGRTRGHFERIPQEVLVKYNALDVYWTLLLHEELLSIANESQLDTYRNHVIEAGRMLQSATAVGMKVDIPYALEVDADLSTRVDSVEKRLKMVVDNPASNQQVIKAIKDNFGYDMASVDSKALRTRMQAKSKKAFQSFATDLLDYRKYTKARSTYVTSILDKVRNGRVHPSYKLHGTVTSRLSSSGPNIQNITNNMPGMPSIRRMFVEDDGFVITSNDFAQAELRVVAELSGDEKMIAALQEDSGDFFTELVPQIYTDVDFSQKVLDKNDPEIAKYRTKLKPIVHGSNYGLTCVSIAKNLTLDGHPTTQAEAAVLQNKYMDNYPQMKEWRAGILPTLLRGEELVTPFGRRYQNDVIRWNMRSAYENSALAFTPQSTASDLCVRAAIWVHREFQTNPRYKDCSIIALVHDCIDSRVPEDLAEEVNELTARLMRESGAMTFHRVPFLTSSSYSKYWSEC